MNENLISMTREELDEWWDHVPGARRFIKTVAREVDNGHAIITNFAAADFDGFITMLIEEIQRHNYSIVIEQQETNGDVVADDFVTDLAVRFSPKYLPDLLNGSFMTDIARKKILSGYVVLVKVNGVITGLSDAVRDFNKVNDADKGAIVFLTSSESPPPLTMKLVDFVTPYDVQFFAINLLEGSRLNQTEKLYTAALIAKLANTSAILAKNLASPELYEDGQRLLSKVFGENFNHRRYERAVWETQIQFALPIVETIREKLIERNKRTLLNILPVNDEFNKRLESPWDMELRHLHYYGGNVKVFSPADWDVLEFVYRVRNDLSHLDALDRDRLDKVFALDNF